MLKKSADCVLAVLRGSTYGPEYASPLRVLRPCRTAILNILWNIVLASLTVFASEMRRSKLFCNSLLRG